MSGYYAQQNAGKRNVSINLNIPGAYDLALKLCDTADIVVENFRAGALGFFGLDYETLSKRNPRLIYASITGYGQGGPWRSRMAYAPTVQAEAGFTENSVRHYGEALKEPRTDSLSHADVYTGLQAGIAILAALRSRQTTGEGQYIDVAMGEIRSIKELTKSEWSDYWGAVQLVSDRSGGEYKLPGRPWHFSRDELTPIGAPAFQGEHNREVFSELGMGEAELQRLFETGALVVHRRALEPEATVKAPEATGQAA